MPATCWGGGRRAQSTVLLAELLPRPLHTPRFWDLRCACRDGGPSRLGRWRSLLQYGPQVPGRPGPSTLRLIEREFGKSLVLVPAPQSDGPLGARACLPRYFEGGVSSVYLWDLDHGFAGVILIKKAGDGSKKIKGCWDSIHVVEVQEKSSGRTAHYKLTSTVMLWLQTNKSGSGTMNLGGSLTRQVRLGARGPARAMPPWGCTPPGGPLPGLSSRGQSRATSSSTSEAPRRLRTGCSTWRERVLVVTERDSRLRLKPKQVPSRLGLCVFGLSVEQTGEQGGTFRLVWAQRRQREDRLCRPGLAVPWQGCASQGAPAFSDRGVCSCLLQMEKDETVSDCSPHIANIGRLVEDMENKIRSTLNEIYFGKTKDIVNGLRSVDVIPDNPKFQQLQRELSHVLTQRQTHIQPDN
ncbi:F-actin-capping protein subunit beta [Galemys pyrenaicus]|uniref:CapZ beta n=1 Tax=Galemys pyrenaicus TaxID=202257 RepID=A0A8J5ZJK1_GALPY|nr:F-actin-capping protein subunit beta [Galemys pyrenaicus]